MDNITNTPVQEPETKKKKINLDKPERFMIFAVLVASGAVPVVTSLISAIAGFIQPLISEIDFTLAEVFSYIARSSENLLSAVLSLAVVVIFACLAYKKNKLKNIGIFLGVFYITQSVLQVIIERPVSAVLNIVFGGLSWISFDMYALRIDWDLYRAVSATTSFLNSSLQFVIDFVCLILMAIGAVALLRIVNGKLKIKFKKKKKGEAEEVQATEEIQENA